MVENTIKKLLLTTTLHHSESLMSKFIKGVNKVAVNDLWRYNKTPLPFPAFLSRIQTQFTLNYRVITLEFRQAVGKKPGFLVTQKLNVGKRAAFNKYFRHCNFVNGFCQ